MTSLVRVALDPRIESGAIQPTLNIDMGNGFAVDFSQLAIDNKLAVTVRVLESFRFPVIPAHWTKVPPVARQTGSWAYLWMFISFEYLVSYLVNSGQPWGVEKFIFPLAWAALLAYLPSAAAIIIKAAWCTRLKITTVQPSVSRVPSHTGQICISCVAQPTHGWLLCDGRTVSRDEFSQLFAAIHTTFGEGDGSTTFHVPDLQGRVAVGHSAATTAFGNLGAVGGEATHTLTWDEMPAHTHSVHDQGHTHHVKAKGRRFVDHGDKDFGVDQLGSSADEAGGSGRTDVASSSISESSAGGGAAHNNMPPYIVMS